MSKLEELIEELCPDGVEYKKLGECCILEKGSTPIQKAIPGQYPLVVTTDERRSSATYQFEKPAVCIPLVSSRGHGVASLNQVYYQEGKFALGNILCGVIPKDECKLSAKFLYQYLNYKKDILLVPLMRGGANVSLTVDSLKHVKIPVPPLEVQREIVRILDNFTKLTEELTTELTARKQQYEYYRDTLLVLTPDDNSMCLSVGDIFDTVTDYVAAGSFAEIAQKVKYLNEPDFAQLVRTVDIKSNFSKGEPVYVDEKAYNFLWRVNLDKECIILPNIGANCGEVYYITPEKLPYGKNVLAPNAIMLRSEQWNNKFMFYMLQTDSFQKQLKKIISPGGQTKFNKTELKKIKVHIPSLETQNKIVSALDQYDILINDLSSGLPAEIEARQKQYEYYRDKLLTFKELGV